MENFMIFIAFLILVWTVCGIGFFHTYCEKTTGKNIRKLKEFLAIAISGPAVWTVGIVVFIWKLSHISDFFKWLQEEDDNQKI